MNAGKKPELITIGFSHYCEKARWALERAGVDFVEHAHLPFFSHRHNRRVGAGRTVPVLLVPSPSGVQRLGESTDILRFCDAQLPNERKLYPDGNDAVAELEQTFDAKFGPATRRFAYFHLLQDKAAVGTLIGNSGAPRTEQVVGRLTAPVFKAALRKGLKIDAAGAARSLERIESMFALVDERLADGRAYLCGASFSAADLTFAALAAPVLLPDGYARFSPKRSEVPASFEPHIARLSATRAGAHALAMYARHRAR